MSKKLWHFSTGEIKIENAYYPQGIESYFLASQEDIDTSINKPFVWFHKDKEFRDVLKKEYLTEIQLDSYVIDTVSKILGETWQGVNPLLCIPPCYRNK